tara:strand:+ start:181 stop:417 length:237 start_codon:yes stop_codon:yes gene_type:complete
MIRGSQGESWRLRARSQERAKGLTHRQTTAAQLEWRPGGNINGDQFITRATMAQMGNAALAKDGEPHWLARGSYGFRA